MKPILLFSLLCIVFSGCNNLQGETRSKDFYTADREADLFRIPLIEPYELINTGFIEESWFFNVPGNISAPANTNQVALEAVWVNSKDSLAGFYNSSIYVSGSGMTEAWFLLDIPGEKIETHLSEEAFNKAAGQKANFKSCSVVFKEFSETGKLPWR